MKYITLLLLVVPFAHAQIEPFGGIGGYNGPTGIGHSTIQCVDRDGDSYGVGPISVINTSTTGITSAGSSIVTPSSMTTAITNVTTTNGSAVITGITNLYTIQAGETISGSGIPSNTTILYVQTGTIPTQVVMSANATASATVTVNVGIGVGTVLRVDTLYNMERVVVSSITGSTFTASFAIAHASSAQITDMGCLGPDGDDLDGSVWTPAQIATKYESGTSNTAVPHFLGKLANDILLSNPGGVSANTAAQVSTLRSPTVVYWLAPSTASPAGSNSNNCITSATPCLTVAGLLTSGARGGTNYTSGSTGVLVFFRQGWDEGQITIFSGTSSKYTIYMSYPGEQATPNAAHFINVPDTSYVRLDGFKLTGGAYISGGTTNTGVPQASISWHDNVYTHIDATGPFSTLGGLNGFGQTNNVFEDSTYHDNSAIGSQHGIYIGSRNLQSTNILMQRLLLYRNSWNGLHFNGMCAGCTVQESVSYANGISGLDFEMGWNNSTIQSNLVFDNAKQITFFDYESGQCPGRTLLQTFTGTTVNSTNTITGISSAITSKFQNGDIVSGPGIPSASAITGIMSTSITISNNATASATVTLTDGLNYQSGTVVICPNDENFNLIQNNTIYASGNDNYPSFNSAQAGCSAIFANCAQNAIPIRNVTEVDATNPGGPQTQAGNFNNITLRNNIVISNGKNNATAPIDYSQNQGPGGAGIEQCDSTCQNWMTTSALDHDVFWQSDGNNGTNILSSSSGVNKFTCSTANSVISVVTPCVDGNPNFADVVQASYYNNKARYDFRLLPTSNALNVGSTTGIPPYDLVGRAYTELAPSIGGIERNLYKQGWTQLNGAGISGAVAPPNGSPILSLNANITSSSATTFTVVNGTDVSANINEIAVGVLIGIESELICPTSVSITSGVATVTTGVNAQCTSGLISISGGTNVAWTAGTQFSPSITSITISGVVYSCTYNSATSITLGSAAANGANQPYTSPGSTANGRGWYGTTATTHTAGLQNVYLNTLTSGGLQGTGPLSYYPFSTQYPQAFTQGVGCDGIGRDIPGQPKALITGPCGGHSNYTGNELYAIYLNRIIASINRIYGPSNFAVAGYDTINTYNFSATNSPTGQTWLDAKLVDGSPNTFHNGGANAYNPWMDGYCKFAGGYAGGNGPHNYDTNCFDFSTLTWAAYNSGGANTHDVDCTNHGTGNTSCGFSLGRQVDPPGTFSSSGFSGLALADPITQTDWPLFAALGNNSVLTQYYPTVHQHVTRASSQPYYFCCGNTAQGSNRTLVSDRRWIVLQGLNGSVGTANVSGTAVTWVGGVFQFPFGSTGTNIFLNGISYPVASINSVTSITLSTPAPTLTGTAYTLFITTSIQGSKIDISSVTSQTPTASPNTGTASITFDSSCLGAVQTASPGMSFMPSVSKILMYPAGTGGGTYYLMDPANWTCTSGTFSGGAPASPFNPYVTGLQQRFESLDVALIVNDTGANVPQVLSLNASDPTGNAPAVASATALQTGNTLHGGNILQ